MTNIRHIWSILCQKSSIDQLTNTLDIKDVLEQINIDGEKFKKEKEQRADKTKAVPIPISIELVSLWDRQDNEKRVAMCRTEVFDPNNNVLGQNEHELVFEQNKKRLRFRLIMNGLPITEAGEYIFSIAIKELKDKGFKEKARIPLTVNIGKIAEHPVM